MLTKITIEELDKIIKENYYCESDEKAVLREYDFSGMDLSGRNFSDLDLSLSNFTDAKLNGCYFRNAILQESSFACSSVVGADFTSAILIKANFHQADITRSAFPHADCYRANFDSAIGSDTYFGNANLKRANFDFAKLHYANFNFSTLLKSSFLNAECYNANFKHALLHGAIFTKALGLPPLPSTCPETGSFIGYKKSFENFIIKLKILESSKRSSSTGRKCRCDKAKVLEIQDLNGNKLETTIAHSDYDYNFVYEVGKIVSVKNFDNNRWNACAPGIHFFITRQEAVDY